MTSTCESCGYAKVHHSVVRCPKCQAYFDEHVEINMRQKADAQREAELLREVAVSLIDALYALRMART